MSTAQSDLLRQLQILKDFQIPGQQDDKKAARLQFVASLISSAGASTPGEAIAGIGQAAVNSLRELEESKLERQKFSLELMSRQLDASLGVRRDTRSERESLQRGKLLKSTEGRDITAASDLSKFRQAQTVKTEAQTIALEITNDFNEITFGDRLDEFDREKTFKLLKLQDTEDGFVVDTKIRNTFTPILENPNASLFEKTLAAKVLQRQNVNLSNLLNKPGRDPSFKETIGNIALASGDEVLIGYVFGPEQLKDSPKLQRDFEQRLALAIRPELQIVAPLIQDILDTKLRLNTTGEEFDVDTGRALNFNVGLELINEAIPKIARSYDLLKESGELPRLRTEIFDELVETINSFQRDNYKIENNRFINIAGFGFRGKEGITSVQIERLILNEAIKLRELSISEQELILRQEEEDRLRDRLNSRLPPPPINIGLLRNQL